MLTTKKLRILSLAFLSVFFSAHAENDIVDTSYGEIYLAQPERLVKDKNDFSLQYGAGLSIPEYKLSSIRPSFEHWFSEIFWAGAVLELNFASKTDLQKNVEYLLNRVGNGISYEYPTMAARASFGVAPFSGLVNIFGVKVLPYELSLSGEIGVVEYKSQTSPGPYALLSEKIWHGMSYGVAIDQRVLLYKNNGIKFGFVQYFENSFDKANSNQRSLLTVGWYGRF